MRKPGTEFFYTCSQVATRPLFVPQRHDPLSDAHLPLTASPTRRGASVSLDRIFPHAAEWPPQGDRQLPNVHGLVVVMRPIRADEHPTLEIRVRPDDNEAL